MALVSYTNYLFRMEYFKMICYGIYHTFINYRLTIDLLANKIRTRIKTCSKTYLCCVLD
jgi:hypothetical protein